MFHFRHVAAQVEGVAEPHHNGASGWSADPIQVIADRFHGSITLNGEGQTQCFGHGITFETAPVLRIRDWTGLRQPIRVWLSLRLSAFLKSCSAVALRPLVPGKWLALRRSRWSRTSMSGIRITRCIRFCRWVSRPLHPFSGSASRSSSCALAVVLVMVFF